jgi:polysaccharide transporter, PST family
VAGLPWGPVGVAAVVVVTGAVIRVPVLFWLGGRRGPVRVRDLWAAIAMPSAAVAAVAATVMTLRTWSEIQELSLASIAGILCLAALAVSVLVYALFPGGRHVLVSVMRLPRTLLNSRNEQSASP